MTASETLVEEIVLHCSDREGELCNSEYGIKLIAAHDKALLDAAEWMMSVADNSDGSDNWHEFKAEFDKHAATIRAACKSNREDSHA